MYSDDVEGIPNDEILWRRIFPGWWIYDENQGRTRPTSQAFNDDENGLPMSVFVARIVQSTGRNPNDVLHNHTGYALAFVTARLARECKQLIAMELDPKNPDPAHAIVFGKKTGFVRSRLAKESGWVIPPTHGVV